MTVATTGREIVEETGAGCFVYGVVGAGSRLPEGATGMDEAPLRAVGYGDVVAVVSDVSLDRPPGRRRDLLAYSAVLDALAAAGPVVPVRFGAVLEDDDTLLDEWLAPDAGYFAELLDQLAGRAQFQLKALYREDVGLREVVAADPEIAELRDRTRDLPEEVAYADRVRLGELVAQSVEAKREDDAAALLDVVLPHTSAHVLRTSTGLEQVLDVALLVDDDHRSLLEEALEGLAEVVHERIRLQLVGPMAPYDFVQEA